MRHSSLVAVTTILLLNGCAAVNPNPNLGMRATDYAISAGDCEGAKKLAEPHALKGEPWAQFRMGALLVAKICPKVSANDLQAAIDWLSKAACYQSKSAWERGNDFVVGPSGYFNARASSTKAAFKLADIFLEFRRPGVSWYYIDRARSEYTPDEALHGELSQRLTDIESAIGPEQMAAIKREKANFCLNGWTSAQPGGQPDLPHKAAAGRLP